MLSDTFTKARATNFNFLKALKNMLQNPDQEEQVTAVLKCALYAEEFTNGRYGKNSNCAEEQKGSIKESLKNLIAKDEDAWLELLFRVDQEWYKKLKPFSPFKNKIVIFTPLDPDDFGVKGDTTTFVELLTSISVPRTIAEGRARVYISPEQVSEEEVRKDEYLQHCLRCAKEDLNFARTSKNKTYARGYIENVRAYLQLANNSPLETIGTNEEEIKSLCC